MIHLSVLLNKMEFLLLVAGPLSGSGDKACERSAGSIAKAFYTDTSINTLQAAIS